MSLTDSEKDRLNYLLNRGDLFKKPCLSMEKIDLYELSLRQHEALTLLMAKLQLENKERAVTLYDPNLKVLALDVYGKSSENTKPKTIVPYSRPATKFKSNSKLSYNNYINNDNNNDDDDNNNNININSNFNFNDNVDNHNSKRKRLADFDASESTAKSTILDHIRSLGFFSYQDCLDLSGLLLQSSSTSIQNKFCKAFGKDESSDPRHVHREWLGNFNMFLLFIFKQISLKHVDCQVTLE